MTAQHHLALGSWNLLDATAAFASLAGILSVPYPFFRGLTVALAALALPIWLLQSPRDPRGEFAVRNRVRWRAIVLPSLVTATGWLLYLVAPASFSALGGLALGASVLGIWCCHRATFSHC